MQTEASFIIRNARVLTMDEANPRAAALAVSGNHILAVGSEAEIDAYSGPDTHVIDAKGATVLPGFNEAHMHIFGGSAELRELSLMGVKGFDALDKALKAYAVDYPQRDLLIAQHADYTILSDDERHLGGALPFTWNQRREIEPSVEEVRTLRHREAHRPLGPSALETLSAFSVARDAVPPRDDLPGLDSSPRKSLRPPPTTWR